MHLIYFIKNKSFETKNEPRELPKVYSKVGHERRLKFQDANYRHSKLVGTNIIIVDTVTTYRTPLWVRAYLVGHIK